MVSRSRPCCKAGGEQENPYYTLILSMSEMATSHRPWNGETGLIDQAMLSRHLSDAVSPIYYVAGPPEMLNKQSVDDDDIRAEEFSGY